MARMIIPLALACLLLPGSGAAEEWDEVPDWAAALGLFVFGGPSSSAVNVRLNGQLVAEVAPGDRGKTYEILEALNSGLNELTVEFVAGNEIPEERGRLTISLATSKIQDDGKRRLDQSIAETSLPADSGQRNCTETYRFWAGLPPPTDGSGEGQSELKKEYILSITGPPVGYLVTILINDHPLYTTSKGERMFVATPFIHKGKNTVTFDAVPACFPEGITATGTLEILLARGRSSADDFVWDPQLLGRFELKHDKDPQPFARKQNFRAN